MNRKLGFLALALGAVAACTAQPDYTCLSNADCVEDEGAQGVCEPNGQCAFVDPTCDDSSDTGLRYPDDATGGVANQCVATGKSCVSAIATGTSHTCVLRTDGTVWCWGLNDVGELASSNGDQTTPSQVLRLPSGHLVTQISAAEVHSCALIDDNTVWCWGGNDSLQLGQCGASPPASSTKPLEVIGYTASVSQPSMPTCNPTVPFTAKQITAGGEHNCAIGMDDNLYCWGENQTGAQGGQSGQDPAVFDDVPGPLKVVFDGPVQVQAGDEYTCVLKDENSVWCFGSNSLGELGNGGTAESFAPINVTGISDASQLVMDDETACVVTRDGGLWCWGNADTGIFGTDLTDNVLKATRVASATTAYGGGTAETIFLPQTDGTLQVLGDNTLGQAGITGSATAISSPTQAELLEVQLLSAGGDHTCAVTTDGAIWCWGDNSHGQIGNGTTSTTPTQIPTRVEWTCP